MLMMTRKLASWRASTSPSRPAPSRGPPPRRPDGDAAGDTFGFPETPEEELTDRFHLTVDTPLSSRR